MSKQCCICSILAFWNIRRRTLTTSPLFWITSMKKLMILTQKAYWTWHPSWTPGSRVHTLPLTTLKKSSAGLTRAAQSLTQYCLYNSGSNRTIWLSTDSNDNTSWCRWTIRKMKVQQHHRPFTLNCLPTYCLLGYIVNKVHWDGGSITKQCSQSSTVWYKYLRVPAMSSPSERVFRTSDNIVSCHRTSLKPDTVDKLVVLS